MNASDLPDETLFEGALKCCTPEERAAYLDKACAGQPELRRNLEALLQAHEQAGEFLEGRAAAARPTIKLDFAPEETPGTVIGRYKLLQKIGEGGMGVVYMAEQTEPVVRKVALKIIKSGMDTRQVVARFEAERQALALMDHPNIAKVLDAGTTETPHPVSDHPLPVGRGQGRGEGPQVLSAGRPFFVMELVHGVPITEYCDKNKLSTQQRLELFIPVCQAIQHAHQKGIIHRDIKPSNVMVTLHDGVPVPKVIDFGVAKATNQRLTEKTLFTHYAQMIGTPAYMSPEQAEMSGLDIDTRTDVYSLGVLLYELLTGTTPFDAKDLLSKGYAEMQRIIAEQEPPKPSTRMSTLTDEQRTVVAKNRSMEAGALRRGLQGDLDWIVMKCLEKDRTRRYETSNGLAADLRRHLCNEVVAARPPSAAYKFQKAWRRNRLLFTASATVATALLLSAVFSTWQAVRANRARHAEAEQRHRAEQNEQRALRDQEAAQRAERETRQNLYAADMFAAQHALLDGDLGQTRVYLRNHIPKAGQPDLRGFEWRYLWDQSAGDQFHTFTGHTSTITTVVFSPNGRWLASAGWDQQVILWDVRERTRVAHFHPGDGNIRALAFHSAGDLLAVGARNGLSLWQVGDIRHPTLWKRHPASDARPAFLPNSSQIVIGVGASIYGYGYEAGFAEIWDYEKSETTKTFTNAGGKIALTADGKVLFTGVRGTAIRRWDVTTGISRGAAVLGWPLRALGCSPDGRWLITNNGEEDNRAQLWDGLELTQVRTLFRYEKKGDVWGVAFSPDNRLAATAHSDQLVRVWTLDHEAPPLVLRGHGRDVWSVAFSPDGTLLASGSMDETVRLWDMSTPPQSTLLTNVDFSQWEEGPAISPDSRLLAIGGPGAGVGIWELDTLRNVGMLTNTAHALRFSRDSKKLFTLDDKVTVRVWDVGSGVQVRSVPLADASTGGRPFVLCPDGDVLLGGDQSGRVTRWDMAIGKQTAHFQAHPWRIYALSVSPDGRRFATASADHLVRLWNTETLKQEREFGGHKDDAFGVAFSADGQLLATTSTDGTLKIWSLADGKELWSLRGHKLGVLDACFNIDGKTIASCSDDSTVKLWNLATGREVGSYMATHAATFAVFSADGNRLIVVDTLGTARVLNAPANAGDAEGN